MSDTNTYGFLNHFRLMPADKKIAQRYDLEIKHSAGGSFDVRSKHGAAALETLASPFTAIKAGDDVAQMTRKELRGLLHFLRQPIAASMDKDARRTGHYISRFATTGQLEIPQYIDEKLAEAASLECHLKGERKMKENDVWGNDAEFWQEEPSIKTVASIPGTSYEPEKGFVLALDEHIYGAAEFTGPYQKQAAYVFWNVLNSVTNNRYEERSAAKVHLSAQETKAFYSLLPAVDGIDEIIRGAKVEEKAQERLKDIRAQADILRGDARFQCALAAKEFSLSPAQKMDNLKMAASALTPFIASKTNYDVWRHSHYMEAAMELSNPVENIAEEYAVLSLVLESLQKDGQASAAELQSVINHFRPLCAFSEDLVSSLEGGAQKKRIVKKIDPAELDRFKNQLGDIRSAFAQSSVNGVSSAEAEGDYNEILKSVGNLMGQNGALTTQAGVGYYDMMKGFWTGVGESAFDSPAFFALVVGLVGYAYYAKYGVDAQTVQQSVDAGMAAVGGIGLDLGGGIADPGAQAAIPVDIFNGFQQAGNEIIDAAKNSGAVDDCILSSNCHYNILLPQPILDALGGWANDYLRFRHYIGVDIIASNAETITNILPAAVEGVHNTLGLPVTYDLDYRETAQQVTYHGGLLFVDANMFQDASHASMVGYGVSRAAKYGLGAFDQMGGLSAEFLNPLRRFVVPLTDVGVKVTAPTLSYAFEKVSLSGAAGWASRRADNAQRRTGLKTKAITAAMTSVGGMSGAIFLEPEHVQSQSDIDMDAAAIKLNIGWYGLGHKGVEINAENIKTLENVINEFALTLEYSSDNIGIESPSYVEFLKARIENVENALRAYRENKGAEHGAFDNLQQALNGDLQHVLGAEIKFNGQAKIYETLFPDADQQVEELRAKPFYKRFLRKAFGESPLVLDDRRRHVLARHASKKEGRLMRSEFRAKAIENIKAVHNPYANVPEKGAVPSLKKIFGAVSQGYNKTKYALAWGASFAWGGIVFAAREGIQEPFNQLPAKKRLAAGAAMLATGALSAEMAGSELGLVKTFSAAGAATLGSISTLLIGGGMNIPQDLALHTLAVGVSAAAVGIPYYLAVQRGAKPMAAALRETLRRDL